MRDKVRDVRDREKTKYENFTPELRVYRPDEWKNSQRTIEKVRALYVDSKATNKTAPSTRAMVCMVNNHPFLRIEMWPKYQILYQHHIMIPICVAFLGQLVRLKFQLIPTEMCHPLHPHICLQISTQMDRTTRFQEMLEIVANILVIIIPTDKLVLCIILNL